MAVINVSEEAHSKAKAQAQADGFGIGEWTSNLILNDFQTTVYDTGWLDPLVEAAEARGESPVECLQNALQSLLTAPTFDAGPWAQVVADCVSAAGCEPCGPENAAAVIGEKFREFMPKEGFQTVGVGMIPVPKPRVEGGCRCDGPEGDGPWHKVGCGRRT